MYPTNSSFIDCEYFGGNFKHKNQGLAVLFLFLFFTKDISIVPQSLD